MEKPLEWLVIGAGPAGIATVGLLLDTQASNIGWLDPDFSVGDLGKKWRSVPSNTIVALFTQFLQGCKAFGYAKRPERFAIDDLPPDAHCLLNEIATPLQWVTSHLKTQVQSHHGEALAMNRVKGYWEVTTRDGTLRSKNVVLSIGAEPKQLSHPHLTLIPLEVALDPAKLQEEVHPKDRIAVFGSSHSAVLVLANLMQLKPKQVMNFYRSPHFYAVDLGDWILFDDGGLKGFAAEWARRHLDGTLPSNLSRASVLDPRFEESFEVCNKVVYAIGFERRRLPVIEQYPKADYQETSGILAPNLFGVGIAFPQMKFDRLGNREYRVGLWKFMDYLKVVLPIWMKLS